MKREDILKLAKELNDNDAVGFVLGHVEYEIWYSDDNNGYMINMTDINDREEIDGGLCTGNAVDAIEFMLPEGYEEYEAINTGTLIDELAEIMTKNASESELKALYYDDKCGYLSDLSVRELVEIKEDM